MVQVELFEEEDSLTIQDEINKFLEKLDEERILKVNVSVHPILLSSGVLTTIYEGLIMYKVK